MQSVMAQQSQTFQQTSKEAYIDERHAIQNGSLLNISNVINEYFREGCKLFEKKELMSFSG